MVDSPSETGGNEASFCILSGVADELLKTPLYDLHVASGGKMVEFAGYAMPVQYTSVLAESAAVRKEFGLFDVSHMARFSVVGSAAFDTLQCIATADLTKLADRQGTYSLVCNEAGGTRDDIIIYRVTETDYHVVVNASNHQKIHDWIQAHKPASLNLVDQTEETFMIAVQGPTAVESVASVFSEADILRASGLFGVTMGFIEGTEVFVARSGYTGEDGVEIIGPASAAVTIWNRLHDLGGANCGLASRDTLRVEAGLPLYGHELTEEMSPLCAGLGWAISKTKPFIGSEKVQSVRESGAPLKLVGIQLDSKRLMQPGGVVSFEGRAVGHISSGVVSPLLDAGIGFAFMSESLPEGTACEVELRGGNQPAQIANKRFFKRAKA